MDQRLQPRPRHTSSDRVVEAGRLRRRPKHGTITDDLADPLHGTSYGRLRPLCSRHRIFSTSAFTYAFSALAVSLVYGSGCWAPNSEPSSNTRPKEVASPFPMKV